MSTAEAICGDAAVATRKSTFHVQINGGNECVLETRASEYNLAALAALALLHFVHASDDYDIVKIWVPDLVTAGYGPYYIGWDGHRVVNVPVERRF